MNKLSLKIITIDKVAFEGEAIAATVPAKDGLITVYANHTPLISVLSSGVLSVKKENGEKTDFKISEGVLEVRQGSNVLVLTDKAEALT